MVKKITNETYGLVNNITPLDYFLPYSRYLFNLTAIQYYLNRSPIITNALVQINLQNFNSYPPIILPNQIFQLMNYQNWYNFGTIYSYDFDNDHMTYTIDNNIQFSIIQIQVYFVFNSNFIKFTFTIYSINSSC